MAYEGSGSYSIGVSKSTRRKDHILFLEKGEDDPWSILLTGSQGLLVSARRVASSSPTNGVRNDEPMRWSYDRLRQESGEVAKF